MYIYIYITHICIDIDVIVIIQYNIILYIIHTGINGGDIDANPEK